ncbi:MAG: P-loop NTPase [Bacteroidota bacterium]
MQTPFRVAVASGKGGTGKTLFSSNMFASLARQGKDVMLIDCDAEEPNAGIFFDTILYGNEKVNQQVPVIDTDKCTFCNQCHDACRYHAIFSLPDLQIINVTDDLCHDCGACYYACRFDAIKPKVFQLGEVNTYCCQGYDRNLVEARMHAGVYSPVKVIDKAIQNNSMAALTILDSPPGTSCPFIHTVAHSEYVILITESTPFGINDLKQAVAVLKDMNKPFGVVVNKVGLCNDDVLGYLKKEKIDLLWQIPFDKRIAKVYSEGKLVIDEHTGWDREFISIYKYIMRKYGIVCN